MHQDGVKTFYYQKHCCKFTPFSILIELKASFNLLQIYLQFVQFSYFESFFPISQKKTFQQQKNYFLKSRKLSATAVNM